MRQRAMIALCGLALPLVACGSGGVDNTVTSDATSVATTVPVTRETAAPPEPAVTAMPAQSVIQSQPGPEGSQVDLMKVAVTGDILTVTLRCSSDKQFNSKGFALDGTSVIDDATSQRMAVLKDNDGKWLASNVSGNAIIAKCEQQPGVFWAKFPAPPATSKTVSINLPETAPFDGVPVTR